MEFCDKVSQRICLSYIYQLTLCHSHTHSCKGPIGLVLHTFQQSSHHTSYCTEDSHLVLLYLHFEANHRSLSKLEWESSRMGEHTALIRILHTGQCISKRLTHSLTCFNSHCRCSAWDRFAVTQSAATHIVSVAASEVPSSGRSCGSRS
jgi:hypothetical protein